MTREIAINELQNNKQDYTYIISNDAIDMAIKALEQDKQKVLDEIRAEIKSLSNANPSYWYSGDMVNREDVLEILDKYKAESEG